MAKLPLIVIATGTPYDIAYFPQVPTYITAYAYRPIALESAVRVITGQTQPSGRLPVTILRANDPTRALYPFGWGLG
jgi:beta-N-acetylhexosaminidase